MHPRAAMLIRELELAPHPEGGHYRRTYDSDRFVDAGGQQRPVMTAIRFLLVRGEASRWHRIDADEAWHWQEGDALELLQFDPEGRELKRTTLGASALGLPSMQVVPAGVWQSARPTREYAPVARTVSPGFDWDGFELLDEAGAVAQELSRLGALHPAGPTDGTE